jgi:hypothetical protein
MSKAPKSTRSFEKIEKSDLIRLGEIAIEVLKQELAQRHGILELDESQISNICLCQGSAEHYLNYESRKSCGVNDFDVWAFFEPQKFFRFGNKKAATADFGPSKFGRSPLDPKSFTGRRVDVFWRAIPKGYDPNPGSDIQEYFLESEFATACELKKKSVIAVWPRMEAGDVLWNPKGFGAPGGYDPWE